jgi:hypothetical protein
MRAISSGEAVKRPVAARIMVLVVAIVVLIIGAAATVFMVAVERQDEQSAIIEKQAEAQREEFLRIQRELTSQPGFPSGVEFPEGTSMSATTYPSNCRITSTPVGATVYVGNKKMGRTPMVLTIPGALTEQVVVSKAGYQNHTVEIPKQEIPCGPTIESCVGLEYTGGPCAIEVELLKE